jgi:hypothetical protein
MLAGEALLAELDEDGAFADWVEEPMHGVLLELRGEDSQPIERPDLLEAMTLPLASGIQDARRSVLPLVTGLIGSSRSVVSLVGMTSDVTQRLLERVLREVERQVPDDMTLTATIVPHTPGRPGRAISGSEG